MIADLAREAREFVEARRYRDRRETFSTESKEGQIAAKPNLNLLLACDLLTRLAAALDGAPAAPDGLVERIREHQADCFAAGDAKGTRLMGEIINVLDEIDAALPAPTPAPDVGLAPDAQALARRAENWMASGVIQKALSEALSPAEIKMLSDVVAALKAAPIPVSGSVTTHVYQPSPKCPWFCKDCGYPEHETLKHHKPEAVEKGAEQ